MATQDKEPKRSGISRRTFLKVSGAAAAAGAAGLDFTLSTSTAQAAQVAKTIHTTCPYCSASCGQHVDLDASGNVLDIYGDVDSPNNNGGLCAKGAGTYQLVNNPRRLGVPEHTIAVDGKDMTGTAWRRVGNGPWDVVALDTAMTEIAAGWSGTDSASNVGAHTGLVALRGGVTPGTTAASNAKGVQFFGSSHLNNEQNYLYRKIIANFGTSCVEHQARI